MSEIKELTKSYLTEEVVILKYIPNFKNGITDKKHPLYGGLSSNASIAVSAPLLTRRIDEIFTKDELAFLSAELHGEDLSPTSSFWREYRKDEFGMANGYFPIFLRKEGAIFKKNNALDYIYLKILEDFPLIANSPEQASKDGSYRFVLIKQDQLHKEDLENISAKKKAYKLHTKYENEEDVLRYILKSFNKNVSYNSKLDFLQKETWKLADVAPVMFIKTAEDELLMAKILLDEALRYKLVSRSNKLYYTIDGKPINLDGETNDIDGAARFLDSGAGQEMKLELEAKIKLLKK